MSVTVQPRNLDSVDIFVLLWPEKALREPIGVTRRLL
jgi:hypothetical protein